jgi:hypothetical protein
VSELAKEKRFDYLLVESTGISEPLPVAQSFSYASQAGYDMDKVAQVSHPSTPPPSYPHYLPNHTTNTSVPLHSRTLAHSSLVVGYTSNGGGRGEHAQRLQKHGCARPAEARREQRG